MAEIELRQLMYLPPSCFLLRETVVQVRSLTSFHFVPIVTIRTINNCLDLIIWLAFALSWSALKDNASSYAFLVVNIAFRNQI